MIELLAVVDTALTIVLEELEATETAGKAKLHTELVLLWWAIKDGEVPNTVVEVRQ